MKTFEPGILCFFFTDSAQTNERTQQCEDDIWDPRLWLDVTSEVAGVNVIWWKGTLVRH